MHFLEKNSSKEILDKICNYPAYLKIKPWLLSKHDDESHLPSFIVTFQSLSPAGSASSGGERDALNVSGGEENELPKSIIVTNVDLAVFDDEDPKVMI
jgi:hypothetical protein